MALRTVAEELARSRRAVLSCETAVESLRLCNRLDYQHLVVLFERLRGEVADLRRRLDELA